MSPNPPARSASLFYSGSNALRAVEHLAQGLAGLGGRATQRRFGGGASRNTSATLFSAVCQRRPPAPGCRPDPLGDDVPKPLFVLLRENLPQAARSASIPIFGKQCAARGRAPCPRTRGSGWPRHPAEVWRRRLQKHFGDTFLRSLPKADTSAGLPPGPAWGRCPQTPLCFVERKSTSSHAQRINPYLREAIRCARSSILPKDTRVWVAAPPSGGLEAAPPRARLPEICSNRRYRFRVSGLRTSSAIGVAPPGRRPPVHGRCR